MIVKKMTIQASKAGMAMGVVLSLLCIERNRDENQSIMTRINNSKRLLAIYCVTMLGLCMTAKGENPIIKNIYTADPAPHGNFGDGKLYLYLDHDTDHGHYGDMFDYHAFSTTNLVDWIDHGSVLNVTDFKWTHGSPGAAWDGDCQKGPGGKYYTPRPHDFGKSKV